jgi:ClpA/ClpB-like protein
MTLPVQLTHPVRLDDLIGAIEQVHPDVLDQLSDAVLAADALGEVADSLIGHFVDRARRSGASWTAIGRSMGVTKQAAQKRFTPKAAAQPGGPHPQEGFGRFTQRARNVVVTAQNEAAGARNAQIGTGHLVLGLLGDPESTAVRALAAQGVSIEQLRAAVTAALPPAADAVPALIPFDDGARAALENAFREAQRLGADSVGTEHVLLALLDGEGSSGPLTASGVTRDATDAAVQPG